VEDALRVGELVDAELRMRVDLLRRSDGPARLEVDDDDATVGCALDSVDGAIHAGPLDVEAEAALRPDERLAVAFEITQIFGDRGREPPCDRLLMLCDPGRLKQQLLP